MAGTSVADWRDDVRELLGGMGDSSRPQPESGQPAHDDLPLDQIKSAVKQFRSRQWQMSADDALDFLDAVFPSRQHDEVLFAILLLTLFKRELPPDTWAAVEAWLDHIDHWQVCDQLAINIAGRLVVAEKARWKVLESCVQSSSEWRRRFAVITACVVHNKGGRKLKPVLKLVTPLMNDTSQHVQNMVGWAVRQVATEDERLAIGFLKKWKGRCNHEIFREASLRLSPDAKITLMKAKSHQT